MPPLPSLFSRLAATRHRLTSFLTTPTSDPAYLDTLHDHLLLADIGVEASDRLINQLRRDASRLTPNQLTAHLRTTLTAILTPCQQPLHIPSQPRPFVILFIGINGAGKTTTLAKLAALLTKQGKTVIIAACDTYRAAAIEQLQHWGNQLNLPVIAQSRGADPAAVAFDAYRAAQARHADVLLIDTAGRQHTHTDLMNQLTKLTRTLTKAATTGTTPVTGITTDTLSLPPHETLMTVDATCGTNALSQVDTFRQAVPLTALCITKLDGSAKGGVVVALAERFRLPIRYIGVGPESESLRPFNAAAYTAALLPDPP